MATSTGVRSDVSHTAPSGCCRATSKRSVFTRRFTTDRETPRCSAIHDCSLPRANNSAISRTFSDERGRPTVRTLSDVPGVKNHI